MHFQQLKHQGLPVGQYSLTWWITVVSLWSCESMMWEEWAIVFSPLGKKLFCFPMEPPAILSMSTILEFLPEALAPALRYHIWRTTVFKISSDITIHFSSIQFSSVQLLSHVQLFVTPWTTARQASLSITNSWSWLRLMSTASVMPSSHLTLCRPLLLLPPIPPSIRVFSNESALHIEWPKDCSFSFNISLSDEYSGLISFRMDW